MSAALKPYRIEALSGDGSDDGSAFFAPAGCRHTDILTEITRLRDELKPARAVTLDLVEAYRREISEVLILKGELEVVQSAINDTRREIASLRIGQPAQVGIQQLSGELGAVVQQTEFAANTIMTAAERIETEMSAIVTHIDSRTRAEAHVSVVMLEVSKLYEACNFQDLTGQRLSRVMDTFTFVERQIDKMMSIWGGISAIDHLLAAEAIARKEAEQAIGDQALANGPRIADDIGHVNQLEIDELFN